MATAVSRPTVWAEDFQRIIRSHVDDSTQFGDLLLKIVKARQDGKFPLSEELLADYKANGKLYNEAIRTYQALKDADGLEKRCSLIASSFFQGVANTEGCELAEEKKSKAKEYYLMKMLEATKSQDLLASPEIKKWLEDFAIASFSSIIDVIDELYEGIEEVSKKALEGNSSQIAKELFQGYQQKFYQTDDLQRLIDVIENTYVDEPIKKNPQNIIKNAFLESIYEKYLDLEKSFADQKKGKFWEVRILSLKAFLNKLR